MFLLLPGFSGFVPVRAPFSLFPLLSSDMLSTRKKCNMLVPVILLGAILLIQEINLL